MTTYHADPVEHAAAYYRDQDRRAQRFADLKEMMSAHIVSCIRGGTDVPVPFTHGRPSPVSYLITDCDDTQQALLFKLVHLALVRDNLDAIYAAADELAKYAGDAYGERYAEGSDDDDDDDDGEES